ncbi:MAG: DNA polymerase IV [candidate division WOR-3 bacterium]
MIWWAHLDLDSFFASVEIASRPYYRDMPVAVGGSEHSRTVITSASYKAREYGIKAGMPVYEALSKCPYLVVIKPDIEKYLSISKEVFQTVQDIAGNVSPYSIDECFFCSPKKDDLIIESLMIKKIIKEKLKITASCGISTKKIVAKIASDENKPDGFFVVDDPLKYIKDKEIEKVPGIGRKMEKKLKSYGIFYVRQIDEIPFSVLKKNFKHYAYFLKGLTNLKISDDIYRKIDTAKSVGNTHTFSEDTFDKEKILSYISLISKHIETRLLEDFFEGNRITLTVRYSNFQTFTKQKKLERYIHDWKDIFEETKKIFEKINLTLPVRLVGISIGGIRDRGIYQELSFNEVFDKQERLKEHIEMIRNKYGESSILTLRDLYVSDRKIKGNRIIF